MRTSRWLSPIKCLIESMVVSTLLIPVVSKTACFTSGLSSYTEEVLRKTSDTLLASETST